MNSLRSTIFFLACIVFSLTSFAEKSFVATKPSGQYQTYTLSTSPLDAAYNTTQISAGISWLGLGGGTVSFTSGTFFVRQPNPSESAEGQANAAITITSTVHLVGLGSSLTYLVADNRATTIFLFEGGNATTSSIRSMTIQGNPYRKINGDYILDRSPLVIPHQGSSLESLVIVDGGGNGPLTYFSAGPDVVFLNPANVGIFLENAAMVQITSCVFNFFSTVYPYNAQTGGNNVGIFGLNANNGVNVWNCSFSGSSYLDSSAPGYNPNPQPPPPGGITKESYAADGLVWLQVGGDFDINGNTITDYRLEATHIQAGPAYIQNNTFSTRDKGVSSTACSVESNIPNMSADYYFESNTVNGGGSSVNYPSENLYREDLRYSITIQANTISLARPTVQISQWTVPAINLAGCQQATIQNNTFTSVGLAVQFGNSCGTASINGNDMRGVKSGCVVDSEGPAPVLPTLSGIDISNNLMAKGISFDIQLLRSLFREQRHLYFNSVGHGKYIL